MINCNKMIASSNKKSCNKRKAWKERNVFDFGVFICRAVGFWWSCMPGYAVCLITSTLFLIILFFKRWLSVFPPNPTIKTYLNTAVSFTASKKMLFKTKLCPSLKHPNKAKQVKQEQKIAFPTWQWGGAWLIVRTHLLHPQGPKFHLWLLLP